MAADTYSRFPSPVTEPSERWVRARLGGVPSARVTRCPYKGRATYWSVRAGGELHEALAWTYEEPIPEQPKIRGLVAFFNERVDLRVDGEALERPLTPWSR